MCDRETGLTAVTNPKPSNPKPSILNPKSPHQFLNMCDRETGLVAVHCRAGLGRTGTLIALHMMKNHNFLSNEAIAWLRIVRPGSVPHP